MWGLWYRNLSDLLKDQTCTLHLQCSWVLGKAEWKRCWGERTLSKVIYKTMSQVQDAYFQGRRLSLHEMHVQKLQVRILFLLYVERVSKPCFWQAKLHEVQVERVRLAILKLRKRTWNGNWRIEATRLLCGEVCKSSSWQYICAGAIWEAQNKLAVTARNNGVPKCGDSVLVWS